MTTYPTPSGAFGSPFDQPVSSRVSLLAVTALVLAILCLPGFGLLAMICGGAAILFISSSKGRLTGLGMAVAGCVIGLVTTVLWGFVVLGAVSVGDTFVTMVQPARTSFEALERGDTSVLRGELTATANAAVSDERILAFVGEYQSDLGAFKSIPDTKIGVLQAYMAIGPKMQNVGNRQNTIPIPAQFESGWAVMLVEVPTTGGPPPAGKPNFWLPIENVGILTPTGEHWLIPRPDPAGPTVTPPTTPAPSDATDPDEPDEPTEPRSPDPDPEPEPEPQPGT